jgi:hypothetical protein
VAQVSARPQREFLARQDRVAPAHQRGQALGRPVLGTARRRRRFGSGKLACVVPITLGEPGARARPHPHDHGATRVRGVGIGGGDAVRAEEVRQRRLGALEPIRRGGAGGRVDHGHARHVDRPGRLAAGEPARGGGVRHDHDRADVVAGVAAHDVAAGRRAEPTRELPLHEAEAPIVRR